MIPVGSSRLQDGSLYVPRGCHRSETRPYYGPDRPRVYPGRILPRS